MAEPSRSIWSFLGVLAVAAFGLNWLWEMAQMSAYQEMVERHWWETLLPCTLATLGEVAVTLAIYGVGALAAGEPRWGTAAKWNV